MIQKYLENEIQLREMQYKFWMNPKSRFIQRI
jgi:hypothetical protein